MHWVSVWQTEPEPGTSILSTSNFLLGRRVVATRLLLLVSQVLRWCGSLLLDLCHSLCLVLQRVDDLAPSTRHSESPEICSDLGVTSDACRALPDNVASKTSSTSATFLIACVSVQSLFWEQVKAIGDVPAPRSGHTFTKVGTRYLLFGGMGCSSALCGDSLSMLKLQKAQSSHRGYCLLWLWVCR